MKYKSEIYEVIHQDAMANFEVGAISEARMREYDKTCLMPEPEQNETIDCRRGYKVPETNTLPKRQPQVVEVSQEIFEPVHA